MATRSVATVFGGSGFIGRYVVKRLAEAGHVVRIAGRDMERAGSLRTVGVVGQIVPLSVGLSDPASVTRAVEGADLVVNLIGILAEPHPGDFHRLQADGAGRIAAAAAAAGVGGLVQVSAIGADAGSPSLSARSKAAGEQAVRAAMPQAVILRPSIVFGPEDQFFNRFAAMTLFSPVMPVIAGPTRFQPVYVCDVADAVMAGLTRRNVAGGTFELGGPRVWTFRELLAWIVEQTQRRRPLITVPQGVARLQASVLEKLPGKLLTRDQLLQLGRDNVVSPGMPGLAELGITATPVELVVPQYLARYRVGGARHTKAPDRRTSA